jgi:hypothetical protein
LQALRAAKKEITEITQSAPISPVPVLPQDEFILHVTTPAFIPIPDVPQFTQNDTFEKHIIANLKNIPRSWNIHVVTRDDILYVNVKDREMMKNINLKIIKLIGDLIQMLTSETSLYLLTLKVGS